MAKRGRLGEVNPDLKAEGFPSYYDVEPTPMQEYRVGAPGFKHTTIPLPKGSEIPPGGLDAVPWQLVAMKPYKRAIIRVVQVSTTPLRLDTGLGQRIVVAIHNLGDNGLWINFTRSVAQDKGEFIPGSPTAGARLGGFWSEYLSSEVEIWGVSDSGTISVAVSEFGF